jgi:hypothetical protein
MTLKNRCLLISGFATLSVVVILGSANAASQDRGHGIQMVQSQPSYNYYNYPARPAVSPGCYLPSDGCISEYTVQN